MPGIPSVYYGSEWGIEGMKAHGTDSPLRPALNLQTMLNDSPHPNLGRLIQRLSTIRSQVSALKYGKFHSLYTGSEQFAFIRETDDQKAVVVLNSSQRPAQLTLPVEVGNGRLRDWLNPEETFPIRDSQLFITIPPNWGRILTVL
jgi:glycosidase